MYILCHLLFNEQIFVNFIYIPCLILQGQCYTRYVIEVLPTHYVSIDLLHRG